MGNCASCGGSCEKCNTCGGCGGTLELTQGEISMLMELAQIPFLPVARRMDDETPIYLEQTDRSVEEYSLILQCLEKKRLITLDFDRPLGRFDDASYAAYPIRGSMALTKRGQQVLELLELQGIEG